jgi:4-amino-4-deoxy-L-arabinose transferase-like glycosyltransferase
MTSRAYTILLFFLSIIFYFSFLGRVHLFDWDEINFAESAREMLVTGNFTQVQINYRPFWEKPPLFFWLQALSMQILGVNEWAARFPNALFGVITLLNLFWIGSRLYSPRMGFWWAMAYFGSFLPHLYFKSGIIDPVFNYFIFLGVYFLSQSLEQKSTRYAVFSGIATGLAVLTKGPVGFLLVFLTFLCFWASERFRAVTTFRNVLLYAVSVAVVSSAWFAVELWRGGGWFFKMFIEYQIRLFSTPDAGHEQPFFYHFVVVFLGCFPMSVFALSAFGKKTDRHSVFRKKMIFLFWVVMILFSIVKTKIVHYSSMAYLPLSFLAAQSLDRAFQRNSIAKWQIWLTGIIGTIFSALLVGLPLFAYNKSEFYRYIKDPFAVDCLKTPVVWGGWEYLIGVFYWLLLLMGLLLLRRHLQTGIYTIFMATALCLLIYTAIVVPKIEGYSQAPAINFYKKLQKTNPDSYVTTVWFKSYAHYFYFKYPRYSQKDFYQENTYQENQQWLLHGKIDKNAYFVVKSNDIERFRQEYPHISFLKKEGGFGFFKRELYPPPRSED